MTRRELGLKALAATPAAKLLAAQTPKRSQPDPQGTAPWAGERQRWVATAERLKPVLPRTPRTPLYEVRAAADPAAFQGWRIETQGPASQVFGRVLKRGDSFTVDFGQHLTGYLRFSAIPVGLSMDAPVRLKLIFGEVPAEVAEPFDPYPGTLSRAWLQDETINIDVLPREVILPRRYAFRYLKVTVVDTSPEFQLRFADIHCDAVTSAGATPPALAAGTPEVLRKIDQVSLRTLRDCMQTVFEDGPKRDRRLWIGDLRLQALTNYVSFKNNDLVKRCLYLFAGLAHEDGLVAACVFEEPAPSRGHVSIMDYAALYVPTLLDYARATGDTETARDLWPVALRQLELLRKYVNPEGLFIDPGKWWIFIDWNNALDRQAAMQGVLVYSLRRLIALAKLVGREEEAVWALSLVQNMSAAARQSFWDPEQGLVVSGTRRQVSWASHAWMTLAGILTQDEAQRCFAKLATTGDAVRPKSPYLYHHVVDAMFACGLEKDALALVESYWGGMVRNGADTFWEVYDPQDPLLSPYNSHLVNSYCHAWSCTPSYFIRGGARAAGSAA